MGLYLKPTCVRQGAAELRPDCSFALALPGRHVRQPGPRHTEEAEYPCAWAAAVVATHFSASRPSCPFTKGLSQSTSDLAQTHLQLWEVPTCDLFLGNQAPPKALGLLWVRRGN